MAEKTTYYSYEDFPYQNLLTYAGLDCIVTSDLLREIWPRIVEEPEYLYYSTKTNRVKGRLPPIIDQMQNIEMKAFEFLCDLRLNGIKYDTHKNKVINAKMDEEIGVLEDQIFTQIGKIIDLDSPKALGGFLYGEMGFEPPFKTKKGSDPLDSEAMKALCTSYKHSWLPLLAKRRDIVSVSRTFIKNYINDYVKSDGRVHPNYSQSGTSSFRITGDNPNLTQLPNPKHGYNVRECFSVDQGNVFIAFDYSSCEVKILGALSRDPELLKSIRLGMDFHVYTAANLKGIDYDEMMEVLEDKNHVHYPEALFNSYKNFRKESKALTFGILYGSSDVGIATTMGVTKERARELITLYFKRYPKIQEYVDCTHKMAEVNQVVVTPFGQRKYLYGTLPMFRKTAVFNADLRNSQNVRIQSTASTVGLDCFSEFNLELKRRDLGKSLCTVYDSLETESAIEDAAEVIELGFQYLDDLPVSRYDWLDFPIGVEAEIGFNWGTVKSVKRGITQKEVEDLLFQR